MNILKPCDEFGNMTKIKNCKNSIFLAEPCPRKNYDVEDWRPEAFEILEELGFNGTVITPTNKYYNKMVQNHALENQTWWEHKAMSIASAIVFWIPRSIEHPAFTTNIEFGEWFKKPNVFFGWPDDAIKNDYLSIRLKENNLHKCETLREILKNAVDSLNKTETMYFTSDTHFCQQRTLELSKRPFVNINEMDLEMISNWNKTITMNDTVIHCGDFGDISKIDDIIDNLNFKKLIWVIGNYERRDLVNFKKIAQKHKNIKFVDYYTFTNNNLNYLCVHEPINPYVINADLEFGKDNYITLFGHIHGRNFAKNNGIDVGTDYHRFSPISLKDVEWYRNAMKFWDENVHTPNVINGKFI